MDNSEKLSLFRKGNSGSIGLTDVPAGGSGSDTLMSSFRQSGANNSLFIAHSGPMGYFYWINGNGRAYNTCNGTTTTSDIVWSTRPDGTQYTSGNFNHLDEDIGWVAHYL